MMVNDDEDMARIFEDAILLDIPDDWLRCSPQPVVICLVKPSGVADSVAATQIVIHMGVPGINHRKRPCHKQGSFANVVMVVTQVMFQVTQVIFQVTTIRDGTMLHWWTGLHWARHQWLGTSIRSQL